ncbi:acylphosphatase [Teredinibacter turnerae]|uniref:acylphosphatase n=1 Tax=Teredinibacter turnerae TaxID=2426 RepID=UPI0004760CD3|nr:acylphosphatase [Teredinibacter turnerae]
MIRHFRVRGKVQGVSFRANARKRARALQLRGWVQNCEDGSVEACASGDESALEEFERWLGRGPVWARVDSVEAKTLLESQIEKEQAQYLLTEFTIRYTD